MTTSPIRVVDEDFTPADALMAEMLNVAPEVPRSISVETDWDSVAGRRLLTLAGQAREAGIDDAALDTVSPGLAAALGS